MSYDNQNPKAYYNQADYTSVPTSAAGPSSSLTFQKPDELPPQQQPLGSPAGPPPPYSPPPPPQQQQQQQPIRDERSYGAFAPSPPPQTGLLGPNRPSSTRKAWNNPHIPQDWASERDEEYQDHHQWQERQQQQRRGRDDPRFSDRLGGFVSHTLSRRRDDDDDDNGDPGCCRKWCKYLFLAILIWLVVLKYSDTLRVTPDLDKGGRGGGGGSSTSCQGRDAVVWKDLPDTFSVEKNVWVTVNGHVSGGRVTVHSYKDHGEAGSIATQIRVSPASLADQLSYEWSDSRDAQLDIQLPPYKSRDQCVEVDMDIWLPDKSEALGVAISNTPIEVVDGLRQMDIVDLKTANAHIKMVEFEGDRLKLQTTNGDIRLSGNVESDATVRMDTSNGFVELLNVAAKDSIELINANGIIQAELLRADDRIIVKTSNAQVAVNALEVDQASVLSSNGPLELGNVQASSFSGKTSNAYISAKFASVKDPNIILETSNGPITAHVTTEYEGRFSIGTSGVNDADIHDALDEGGNIEYDINQHNRKEGTRLKGGGSLISTTSLGDIDIAFDVFE